MKGGKRPPTSRYAPPHMSAADDLEAVTLLRQVYDSLPPEEKAKHKDAGSVFFTILGFHDEEGKTMSNNETLAKGSDITPTPATGNKRRAMGRGLSALLGEAPVPVQVNPAPVAPTATSKITPITTAPTTNSDRTRLPIESLVPGPFQPRRIFSDEALNELAQSIREKGVLQPILVRANPTNKNEYQIIGGERRWRASQLAGLHEVPVILRDFTDAEAMEAGIIENVQRQDLTALEEAEAFQRLLTEYGHTHEDLARVIGKSRTHITNAVRLLKLPVEARTSLEKGEISAGHARVLISVENPQALLERIVRENLSVRATEDAARNGAAPALRAERQTPKLKLKNPNVLALEKELSQALGLRVQITASGQSGTIAIRYNTLDQLEPVLAKLRGE